MDVMDIIIAADGIRDEDILDAEEAAHLAPERVIPLKRKKPAVRRALYVLLPATAGIVLVVGALGNMRMGSGGAAPQAAMSAQATAEAPETAAGGVLNEADIRAEAAAEEETGEAKAAGAMSPAEIDGTGTAGTAEAGGTAYEGVAEDASKMVFLDGRLYTFERTGEVLDCGMYDFTIEKVVPETEEPTEELTANFEAEGGVYLEDNRIAVFADGLWYVFILKEEAEK